MLKKFLVIFSITLAVSMFTAAVAQGAEYKFKEQDIAKATAECADPSPCKPELVPTKDDEGNVNLALLEAAKPNADSTIAGWCPARHCLEFLNDGFYNNCRSWITNSGGPEAWAEIDLGAVYVVKKVAFGSDHCGNYKDRAAKKFRILTATQYDKDSGAATWKELFAYDKADSPINQTNTFKVKESEAGYVRISVLNGAAGVRIDEIEVYGTALTGTAVFPQGKLTTAWGQIKKQH